MHVTPPPALKQAFSLVELSIVLVILGLLVGGVLSGKALIRAAEIRSQIKQIESYTAASRMFREKYLYLPGDMPLAEAVRFKFYRDGSNGVADSGCNAQYVAGCGNGDGKIGRETGDHTPSGEPHLFWLDLMVSGLANVSISGIYVDAWVSSSNIAAYLPKAALDSQYVYVWTGGVGSTYLDARDNGYNYLTISGVSQYTSIMAGYWRHTSANIRVDDAASLDRKMDDGLPQYGIVTAVYIGYITGGSEHPRWAGASSGYLNVYYGGPTTVATPASATTCYDNNNTAGVKQAYSVTTDNGSGKNCALSFRM